MTPEQLILILNLLSNGKLPSQLLELLTLDTDNNYLVLNNGLNDAKKIKVPLLRGFKGSYNANTNTPSLTNGVGLDGDMHLVSVAGSRDFGAGTVNLLVDDIIIYLNGKYLKTSAGSQVFNSQLSSSLAMQNAVGSISAGTTIEDLQGLTFTQYIENQNFPTVIAYINDASNLALSGFSISSLEVGAEYSFTAVMSFNTGEINNGDNTLAGSLSGNALTFELQNPDLVTYVNNSVTNNTDSTTTTLYSMVAGVNTWTFSGTNSAGTTSYTDNKGGADIVASIETAKADTIPSDVTFSKTGYYPMFYGMSTNDTTSAGSGLYLNSDLTKNIASTGNRSVSLNGTNEYVYFSYPSSSGALSSIIDGNGFDVTNSFTLYTVNVTSSGQDTEWTEQYNIYRTTSVTTVIGQTFDFNF
jgi:hypothetical protein